MPSIFDEDITIAEGSGPEQLLILSSRFRGVQDTLESYSGNEMTWLSPALESAAASRPQAAPSFLLDNEDERVRMFTNFSTHLTRYFTRLRESASDYYSKLGLTWKAKTSIPAVVQAICDAMDLNGFVPVGYHTAGPSPVTGPDGKTYEAPGSFYFHAVLYRDLSWSVNFTARISLHLSRVQVRTRERPDFHSPDYELGDFYEVRLDPSYKDKVATDLGIDVESFQAWLSIKKDAYYKRKTGKLPSESRVEEVVAEYRKLLARLAREQAAATMCQYSCLNDLSIVLRASATARNSRFTDARVPVPGYDPKDFSFKAGPVVIAPPVRGVDPVQYLELLDRQDQATLETLTRELTKLSVRLDMYSDIFAAYQSQVREALDQLDFLAEDRHVEDLPISVAIDAFMDMFQFATVLFSHLAALVKVAAQASSSASRGDLNPLLRYPSPDAYWDRRILSPLDGGGLTAADTMTARWGRFSKVSTDLLRSFLKAIKSSKGY